MFEYTVAATATALAATAGLITGTDPASWVALGAAGTLTFWADADDRPRAALATTLGMIAYTAVLLHVQGAAPLGGPTTWLLAGLGLATTISYRPALRAARRTEGSHQ